MKFKDWFKKVLGITKREETHLLVLDKLEVLIERVNSFEQSQKDLSERITKLEKAVIKINPTVNYDKSIIEMKDEIKDMNKFVYNNFNSLVKAAEPKKVPKISYGGR